MSMQILKYSRGEGGKKPKKHQTNWTGWFTQKEPWFLFVTLVSKSDILWPPAETCLCCPEFLKLANPPPIPPTPILELRFCGRGQTGRALHHHCGCVTQITKSGRCTPSGCVGAGLRGCILGSWKQHALLWETPLPFTSPRSHFMLSKLLMKFRPLAAFITRALKCLICCTVALGHNFLPRSAYPVINWGHTA